MFGPELIIAILLTSFIGYFCLGVGGTINPDKKEEKSDNEKLGEAVSKAVAAIKKEWNK